MENKDFIYRRLQEHMNRMPVGFPESETGSDIRILKKLFTPEEAQVALELSMLPETIDRIYPRIKDYGYTKERAVEILNSMHRKGIVLSGELLPKKGDKLQYSTGPWAIGIFELNAGWIPEDISADIHNYMKNTFRHEAFQKDRPGQMRTIPIGKSIKRENITATYDDVRQIILNAPDPIVISNCVCREVKDKMNEPCKLSKQRQTCIYLRSVAKHSVEVGRGKVISKNEMLSLLDKFEETGYVLQPENSKEPNFICCCCGCCCEVLTSAKQFQRPTEFYYSNYYAVIDSAKCDGNGRCMKRCQMGAITVKDKKAIVNLDRCIGCGLCTTTCRTGALALVKREKVKIPPKNHDVLYQKILMKKIGPLKTIGVIAKYMLGIKV